MVQKHSAQLFWQSEHRIPVLHNHAEMVKFASKENPAYSTTARYLTDHVAIIGKDDALK